jgi:hypothetical protein
MEQRLVEDKKRAILAAGDGGLEKGSDMSKDLLSVLSQYLSEV